MLMLWPSSSSLSLFISLVCSSPLLSSVGERADLGLLLDSIIMESLQQLAIESFSYRWLLLKSLESPPVPAAAAAEDDEEMEMGMGYFIEMDLAMERVTTDHAQDFYFSLPSSSQPLPILDADQLFCNGFLMPLHLLKQQQKHSTSSSSSSSPMSTPPPLPPSSSPPPPHPPPPLFIFRGWKRSSKRILRKYLGFMRQLVRGRRCAIIRCGNSSSSSSSSSQTTPRTSSIADWTWTHRHRSNTHINTNLLFDSHIESSIYEAVLHCKK